MNYQKKIITFIFSFILMGIFFATALPKPAQAQFCGNNSDCQPYESCQLFWCVTNLCAGDMSCSGYKTCYSGSNDLHGCTACGPGSGYFVGSCGVQCLTNSNCLSTQHCSNYTCVNNPTPTPTPACVRDPNICNTLGYACGSATSCGTTYNCGTCPAGKTCSPANHVCITSGGATPNCNSGITCGPCSVSCGGGTKSCTYTTYTGGGACNQVAAPSQICNTQLCPTPAPSGCTAANCSGATGYVCSGCGASASCEQWTTACRRTPLTCTYGPHAGVALSNCGASCGSPCATPPPATPPPATPPPATPPPGGGCTSNSQCGFCQFCTSTINGVCQQYSTPCTTSACGIDGLGNPVCTTTASYSEGSCTSCGGAATPPPPPPCSPSYNEQIAPVNSYTPNNGVTYWGTSASMVVSATGSGNFYLNMNNSCGSNATINSVAVPFANYYTSITYPTYTSSGTYCYRGFVSGATQLACPSATTQCTSAGSTNCTVQTYTDTRTGSNNCTTSFGQRGDTYSSSCAVRGTQTATYGAAITPNSSGCPGLPGGSTSCGVNGNNSPVGQYIATANSTNSVPNKSFPLNVYVVNPEEISYTCISQWRRTGTINIITLSFKDFGGTYYCAYDGASGSHGYELGCANGAGNGTSTDTIIVSGLTNGVYNINVVGWKNIGTSFSPNWILVGGLAEALNIIMNNGVCTVAPTTPSPTPVSTPAPGSNVISGNVFVDANKNQLLDSGESDYSGGTSTINIYQGSQVSGSLYQTIPTSNGIFTTGNVLPVGTYTVAYTGLPTGYQMTIPVNGPPPSFTVTLGPGCSVGGSNSASCDANGDIANLNFGITNSIPWIQGVGGGDIGGGGGINAGGGGGTGGAGAAGGFNDPIPSTALAICGGPYASVPGNTATTPGLIFTGIGSAYFGQGSASLNNWIVGGTNYPDSFGPIAQGGFVKTSYAYLQSIAKQANIPLTNLSTVCNVGLGSVCNLPSDLPHGIYIANGDLTLGNGTPGDSYTFLTNSNYIILVNGNLIIQTQLHVPIGSTALFSVSGNITVDKSVGEQNYQSSAPDIEGVFSADQNFNINGQNDCTIGPDFKLNVAGSIITNAALSGGTFINQRDLCANNIYCPVFTVQSRPDFILNAPNFIKKANYTWQELAP